MNRYIIALPCEHSYGGWADMKIHSKILTKAGFKKSPSEYHSRDSFELHWLIECTEPQLTMLMLKTSATLVRQIEDPWKTNIPF